MTHNTSLSDVLSVSDVIKEKRNKLNMTQKELADAIGLPKYGDRTIRRWENGETEPSKLELFSILEFPEISPFKNIKNTKYSMIDLFAGIGGTRLGFHQTSQVKSVFSSEIDKFSIKTYKANFGDSPMEI
ncbi:helix-turn-helix domain-containing protein [Staphylococcus xylosus]